MSPRLFLPAAAFIVLGATPAGAVLLVHDDGTAETTFGAYSSIDTIWLVHYNTPDLTPYWAVSDVRAVFGSPVSPGYSGGNGQALTFGVWSDPNGDGNPADGLLLGSGSGVTSFVDTITFGAPVELTTSSFFVGYYLPVNNTFPVGFDRSTPLTGTSYALLGNTLSDLSLNSAPYDLSDSDSGVSMISADVVAVPEPANALGVLLLLGSAVGLRFRSSRRMG